MSSHPATEQRAGDAQSPLPEPPVRGEGLLRGLEAAFLLSERWTKRLLPDALNPLLHTGAIANTLLLIAIATGGVLLFWYSPSVHHAHASMLEIEAAWLPRLIRSLHRYSSDGCVFFVALHALRLTAARRFTGARWLAWVTGLAAVALLWATGWTGYWLVWDQRAQQVAIGSARFLDKLPVFSDRLESAFLTDASVNSLLFFIVFFVHMLIPMAMGIALWLHIARLQRPDFLLKKWPAVAVGAALVALSLVVPAAVVGPARMNVFPTGFSIDGWYLLPLWLTDNLRPGVLWAICLGGGAVLLAVPWLLRGKRARPATIVTERCSACEHCVQDCPYEAISLVPRTDGKPYALQAQVDPSRCVGCGICNASCATAGSGLPHFDTLLQRSIAEDWLEAAPPGDLPSIAWLCHDAVPASLQVNEATGACPQLPGYRVMKVPCAGWVHAITAERLLRRGAKGILIAGCAGNCRFREGLAWTEQRMAGTHDTPLRTGREQVRVIAVDRLGLSALTSQAAAFRASQAPPRQRRFPTGLGGAAVAVGCGAAIFAGSVLPYSPPRPSAARLAISFKHPGVIAEKCRTLTPEEQAAQPAHMRRTQECDRGRQPVKLKLSIDGTERIARTYPAAGLWGDGSSFALEELDAPAGPHTISVAIDDGSEQPWQFHDERKVELVAGERRTVLFDRTAGFSWH